MALEASLAAKGGWMGRCELMDALDAYIAGMSTQPKPRVSAQKGAGTFANKTFSDKAVKMVVILSLRPKVKVKVMQQRLSL